MIIRRAVPDDYAAVGALTEDAYEEFIDDPEDYYRAALRDAARRDREAELWVAEDDDELVGTVTYCPLGSPWRELGSDEEAEFRMLAVAPKARGRGVGEALVRHCEARAKGRRSHADGALDPRRDDLGPSHLRAARLPPLAGAGLVPAARHPAVVLRQGPLMEATLTFTVTDADTAQALGSGSLPVLGTPSPAGVVRGGVVRGRRPDPGGGRDQRRHPRRSSSTAPPAPSGRSWR